MTTSIPDPTNYGISPKYGFLSPDKPLSSFKDPYYEPWDAINANLSNLIKSEQLERQIEKLPLLSTDKLSSDLDYRRAYVVLAFLVHANVWGSNPPNQNVPPQIAEPFLMVCEHLGLEPVVSYAGLCTWNWTIRNGGGMDLENMDTVGNFTGTVGEAAFYHVPVLVEYEGGHLIHVLLNAIQAAAGGERTTVIRALNETATSIDRMSAQLGKLYSHLDAKFFYHEHRPFMAGGKGMEEKGLPRGMVFQKSDSTEVECRLVGGSAVQSPFFPFLDYVLGVEHVDDTFKEMRAYMPGAHRDFLDEVSRLPSLREYVHANPEDTDLVSAYDDCMNRLRSWRGKHIALVSKYIVQPAREAERAAKVDKLETTGPKETDEEWELQGTGGSALMPFLKQARDETAGYESEDRIDSVV